MTVPVPCYLVEWYHSAVTEEPLDDTVARLKDSAVLMSAQGAPVRLLNLLAVPTDEVLFAVFTADSATAVAETCDHAGIPAQRVSTATELDLQRGRPLRPNCRGGLALFAPLGPAPPVFDAVVVRREAMTDAPEHGLGSAADLHLAVDRPNVGLHGVGAQVGQPCHVGIALALRDESEDLGLAVAESLAATGPVKSDGASCARWSVTDYHLAGVDRL